MKYIRLHREREDNHRVLLQCGQLTTNNAGCPHTTLPRETKSVINTIKYIVLFEKVSINKNNNKIIQIIESNIEQYNYNNQYR